MTSPVTSLADVIRVHARERGREPMTTYGDRIQSFGDVYERAQRVARALAAAGVGGQDRVAFLDKNGPEFFEVVFGAALLSAVSVSVNWRLAAREMQYIVNDSEARVLVVHRDFAAQLADFERGLEHVKKIVVIGGGRAHESYEVWIARHAPRDPGALGARDDVCLQLYTSGTTGLPKGAQLTNGNLLAMFRGAEGWGMGAGDVNLVAMPLFHIGGSGWALAGMARGCHSILLREIEPTKLLPLIAQHGVTHAFLVPAVLQFLLAQPSERLDLSRLRFMAYGASPIAEDVLVRSMKQLGCRFVQLYGLTETTGAVVQLDPEDHQPGGAKAYLLRSAGKPMRGVELKIVDPATGEALPDGTVGEVWVRSDHVMKGYWKLEKATQESLPGSGWFKSGDAGYLRDGYLFIHDRVKDMIISGGENIYPAEIENALMGHPGVADIAVIGVPSEKWGETPKALVVRAPDATPTGEELIAWCRERLAKYKCPTSVDFIAVIPRNPSGKVLKRELREPFWKDRHRKA